MSLKQLLKAPAELSKEESKSSVKWGIVLMTVITALVFGVATLFAFMPTDPEGQLFLAQASVRIGLGSLLFGVTKFGVSVAFALVAYQIFENSELGQRLKGEYYILSAFIIAAALAFGFK